MRRVLPALATLIAGCATARAPAENSAATATSTAAAMPAGHGTRLSSFALPRRLVDGRRGAVLDAEAVFADLLEARVIYVSEQHNNPHHHAAQLSVIAGVWARDPSVAIGLEMIKRPFQPALDDYLIGEIDAEELLSRCEWDDRWGYSFELYRGIFEFARAHKIPLHALNAPDEITRAVAGGGVKSLSDDERASLPDLDLTDENHRAMVKEAFDSHHGHAKLSFDDFYEAQVIWDETMAYEIARALAPVAAPKRMIVLAGDGHIRHGFGIPRRAERRGATPFRTILPVMLAELEETVSESAGDYLWVMARSEDQLPAVRE
jgi:uncharacterized iron-regulated protein